MMLDILFSILYQLGRGPLSPFFVSSFAIGFSFLFYKLIWQKTSWVKWVKIGFTVLWAGHLLALLLVAWYPLYKIPYSGGVDDVVVLEGSTMLFRHFLI